MNLLRLSLIFTTTLCLAACGGGSSGSSDGHGGPIVDLGPGAGSDSGNDAGTDTGGQTGDSNSPDTQFPAPQNFVATGTTQTGVSLRWDSYSAFDQLAGYRVYRDGEQVAEVARDMTIWTESNLDSLRTYRYSLEAFDQSGTTTPQVHLNVTTLENLAPTFAPITERLFIPATTTAGVTLFTWAVEDPELQPLRYVISEGNEQQLFRIDAEGKVSTTQSLTDAAARNFTLTLEAQDGANAVSESLNISVMASEPGASFSYYNQVTLADLQGIDPQIDQPAKTYAFESLEFENLGNNYGMVTEAYLVPETTGDYTFYIAGDDETELYISADHTAEKLALVAYRHASTAFRDFTRSATQTSEPITLQAGQYYALRALLREGGGADHMSVAWQGPGDTEPTIIGANAIRPVNDLMAPTAPNLFAVAPLENSRYLLTWETSKDNVGIAYYNVIGNQGELLATTEDTSITLTGLQENTRYHFAIQAVDLAGNLSPLSNSRSIVINDTTPPLTPTGFQAESTSQRSTGLRWSTGESNLRYALIRNGNKIAETMDASYLDTKLEPAQTYAYELVAIDRAGNRSAPATLELTTPDWPAGSPAMAREQFHFVMAMDRFSEGTKVGTVAAAGDNLRWRIAGGEQAQSYHIDADTGVLTLAKSMDISAARVDALVIAISNERDGETVEITADVSVHFLSDFAKQQTGASREYWSNQDGSAISDIDFLAAPALNDTVATLDTPLNQGHAYSQRFRAYLKPAVSGEYRFYLAADDAAQLWVSDDAHTANTRLAAEITSWVNRHQFKGSTASFQLEAGSVYYLEALHKEGSGGDHFAAAWQTEGMSAPAIIPGDQLIPFAVVHPEAPQVVSATQTGYEQGGNQLSLTIELADEIPDTIIYLYIGTVDGGEQNDAWDSVIRLDNLHTGINNIVIDDIDPGSEYFYKTSVTTATGTHWGSTSKIQTEDAGIASATKQLPDALNLKVTVNSEEHSVFLERYSVRMPGFALYTYDHWAEKKLQKIVPTPEVRTYRGFIEGNDEVMVAASINPAGSLTLSAWGGNVRFWSTTVDVSDQINADATSVAKNDEISIKIGESSDIPETTGNLYYQPEAGMDFHTNLVAAQYIHRMFDAETDSILNALTMMEAKINEFDIMRGRDVGQRWKLSESIIQTPSLDPAFNTELDELLKPDYFAEGNYTPNWNNFLVMFKDGSACHGGGYFVGCWTGYTAFGIDAHEIGHNFSQGHAVEEDTSNNTQGFGTGLEILAARGTLKAMQTGSRMPMAEPMDTPMPPKAFKDYATVYINQSTSISPVINDYDSNGDALALDSVASESVAGGSVLVSGSKITYTPPLDYTGTDSFHYYVTDGALCTKGSVEIQVLGTDVAGRWNFDQLVESTFENSVNDALYLQAMSAPTDANASFNLDNFITAGVSGNAFQYPTYLRVFAKSDPLTSDPEGHKRQPHYYDPGYKSFSAALHFRLNDTEATQVLLDKGTYTGWQLYVENQDLVARVFHHNKLLITDRTIARAEGVVTAGNWQHAAIVIDRAANRLRVYLNGDEVASSELIDSDAPILSGAPLASYSNTKSVLSAGKFAQPVCNEQGDCTPDGLAAYDDVVVYHKALSTNDVKALATP